MKYKIAFLLIDIRVGRISDNKIFYIVLQKSLLTNRHKHYFLNVWYYAAINKKHFINITDWRTYRLTCRFLSFNLFYIIQHFFMRKMFLPLQYLDIWYLKSVGYPVSGQICIRLNPDCYKYIVSKLMWILCNEKFTNF